MQLVSYCLQKLLLSNYYHLDKYSLSFSNRFQPCLKRHQSIETEVLKGTNAILWESDKGKITALALLYLSEALSQLNTTFVYPDLRSKSASPAAFCRGIARICLASLSIRFLCCTFVLPSCHPMRRSVSFCSRFLILLYLHVFARVYLVKRDFKI